MKEIVRVNLDNEMDLILAHKRVMKLCELTGFSLISQTSIATAISEIARCAIEHGKDSILVLSIETTAGRKTLRAVIHDSNDFSERCADAINYAKRLIGNIEVQKSSKGIQFILKQQILLAGILSESKIDSFIDYFKSEPPLSPYDELRRKNLLLQDLAEKVKGSEDDYKILTDSLPLMMFSANNRGVITYTNRWLQDFLGSAPKDLSPQAWQPFIQPGDFPAFTKVVSLSLQKFLPIKGQYQLREKDSGEYIWHMISVNPVKSDKDVITNWIGFIVDVNAEIQIKQTLKDNKDLREMQLQLFKNQDELQSKVIELNRSNYELEQFAHMATHDLQEPLRKLFYYTDVLKKRYREKIDETGVNMLQNMSSAASRMKELITDLLSYSQLHKQTLQFENVDLEEVVNGIIRDLEISIHEKNAVVEVNPLPTIVGNALRLRQLFNNLISNALKYSRKEVAPYIKIVSSQNNQELVISVEDNGIGFDEEYSERIFGLFERLHTRDEYPGTGIGLSICKRITELHAGSISAKSVPGEYSIFTVTLPLNLEAGIIEQN